jgi:hypothetical protein
MCNRLAFLESLLSTFDPAPVPIPKALHAVAQRLAELGYSHQSIDGALGDIARCGSAWGSNWVDEEDLEQVEELIPGVSAWQWPAWTDAEVRLVGERN